GGGGVGDGEPGDGERDGRADGPAHRDAAGCERHRPDRASGDVGELEHGDRDGQWQRAGDRGGRRPRDDHGDERRPEWIGGPHGHHRAGGVGGGESGDGEPAGGPDGAADGDAAGGERHRPDRAGRDVGPGEHRQRDGEWQRGGDWHGGGSRDDHGDERRRERQGGDKPDGRRERNGRRDRSRSGGGEGQLGDAGGH